MTNLIDIAIDFFLLVKNAKIFLGFCTCKQIHIVTFFVVKTVHGVIAVVCLHGEMNTYFNINQIIPPIAGKISKLSQGNFVYASEIAILENLGINITIAIITWIHRLNKDCNSVR